MAIIRQYDETNFVTSLRALAAMMVVVIHTGAFTALGQIGSNITNAGKYGVEIFFVISGFSIAVTFRRAASYHTFAIRRAFRIVPLYVFVITSVFMLTRLRVLSENGWLLEFHSSLNAYNYLMHVFFVSCLDHRIANSILGVEWTIPIEVFWYAALPLILMKAQSRKHLTIAFVFAIAAILVTKGLAYLFVTPHPGLFAKWLPTSYGPFFLLGVIAYQLRQTDAGRMKTHAQAIVRVCIAMSIASLLLGLPGGRLVFSLSTCLIIGLFEKRRHSVVARILEFKPFLYLGTISYSVYLTHLPIATFLRQHPFLPEQSALATFLLTFAVTCGFSTILYLLVEKPTNAWGSKVAGSKFVTRAGSRLSSMKIPVASA
ncbi:MAG: acyltransferase [Fuerstiella sp.]